MGHYLDPLLDQVKSKYSTDVQEAHESGLREGSEYMEYLILEFIKIPLNVGPNRTVDVDELLEFVRNRPIAVGAHDGN